MSNNGAVSSDWELYIETNPGKSFCRMLPLECADLTGLTDNTRGRLRQQGRHLWASDGTCPTITVREFESSTLGISVTEDAGDVLEQIVAAGCPIALQRRRCPQGGALEIEHLVRVRLDYIQKSQLTASGVNASNGVPTLTIPGLFDERFVLNNVEPDFVDVAADEVKFADTVIDVVFCGCGNCCGVGHCDRLYRLWASGKLETSTDGGQTWVETPFCSPCGGAVSLICLGSTVFVSFINGATYFSSDPENERIWSETVGLTDPLVDAAAFGAVLYAITKSITDSHVQIFVSQDTGRTWTAAYESYDAEISHLAAGGSVVAAAGINGWVVWSDDRGRTWNEHRAKFNGSLIDINAITVSWTGTRDQKCVQFMLASLDNKLYQGHPNDGWTNVYNASGLGTSEECDRAHLFSYADGRIHVFHRWIGGRPVTLRNFGDCYDWVKYEHCSEQDTDCTEEALTNTIGMLGCEINGTTYFWKCCACTVDCICDIPGYEDDDGRQTIYGCVDPDTGETLVIRCDTDCERIYWGPENPCPENCGQSTECDDLLDCDQCDGTCTGPVVATITADECGNDFLVGLDVDIDACSLTCGGEDLTCVGEGLVCGDENCTSCNVGGTLGNVCCNTTSIAAVCPFDLNKVIVFGTAASSLTVTV